MPLTAWHVISWSLSLGTVLITGTCVWVTWRGSRRWYRAGWIEGREAMMRSLAEAQTNGVDLDVWAISEALADGIPVYDYADEDGKPHE